ncbi:tetratricopeptide repeat protein [Phaeovibrio sulfidiphilus]|uniref:Tetratricopeptide repeat protein n=1 Tax=Phaeovibrio sulfidiphilus TaxID=1220600 RepID=A0A8J6Z172_9PROT|nr:tetratricopeptide repeat protein [Phaeovibrio sulfidiphilus]MBE1237868.1 tetratricopeptide repeat protein [Phaeovibrio sulfidiphilus]
MPRGIALFLAAVLCVILAATSEGLAGDNQPGQERSGNDSLATRVETLEQRLQLKDMEVRLHQLETENLDRHLEADRFWSSSAISAAALIVGLSAIVVTGAGIFSSVLAWLTFRRSDEAKKHEEEAKRCAEESRKHLKDAQESAQSVSELVGDIPIQTGEVIEPEAGRKTESIIEMPDAIASLRAFAIDASNKENWPASIELWKQVLGMLLSKTGDVNRAQINEARSRLGVALGIFGSQERSKPHLLESVALFLTVSNDLQRQREPLENASTQNNLGNALSALGELENTAEFFEEAEEAYRAAIIEYERMGLHFDVAATQNNLGNALYRLGKQQGDPERLNEALKIYNAALQVLSPEQTPVPWGNAMNGMGNALHELGVLTENTGYLGEAEEALRSAMKVRARAQSPRDWAMTQNNLGNVLRTLGEREAGTERLEEAATCYRNALQVFHGNSAPYYLEHTSESLEKVEALIRSRNNGGGDDNRDNGGNGNTPPPTDQ